MKVKHKRVGKQPGVERHVVDLTGPEAFKINPKKPNPDSKPIWPVGHRSVDKSDKKTTKARRKLDNVRI
jgi:hypothetical protein